jgi:type I restriction enzyme, S subunit
MKVEERVEQEALFEPPLETPKVKAERLPLSSFNTETELPEGWEWIRLGRLLEQQERKVRLEPDKTYTRLGVRWYAEGPFVKEAVLGRDIKGKDLYSVEAGEFIFSRLFAWKGSFGFISDLEHGAFVSNEFPTFKPNTDILDSEFLWRMFSQAHVWRFIEERSEGSTQTSRLRFKEADLLRLEIPLPPLPEQKAIAAALRAVRDSREATARAFEEAKAFKRSLMRHVFTFGPVSLEEAATVELQETEIGSIPKNWDVNRLGDLTDFFQYGTSKKSDYNIVGNPILRIPNVAGGHVNTLDMKFTALSDKELNSLKLEEGDLLFVRTNGRKEYVGRCAVYENEPLNAAFASYLIRCKLPGAIVNPNFMREVLNSYVGRQQLDLVASDAADGKYNINSQTLRNLVVPVPSKSDQDLIEKMLQTDDTKIESLESRLSSLDALFQSLLYHLMTGRMRVPSSTTGDA